MVRNIGLTNFSSSSGIVSAEMQNIVYGPYLPEVIGEASMDKYRLGIDRTSDYNPDADPSITNAFATAAYRFGHTMIASMVKLIDVVTAAETTYR